MKKLIILYLAFLCCYVTIIEPKSRKQLGKNIVDPLLTSKQPLKKPIEAKPNLSEPSHTAQRDELKVTPPQKNEVSVQPLAIATTTPKKVIDSSQKEITDDHDELYLNFENADLMNFVNYVADLHKINIFPDKGLGGAKISLTTRKPLSKAEALNLLHSIIDMSGYCLIKDGSLYKITQNTHKLIQPLPTFINVPAHTLPSSDENIRYVTLLNNIKANDVKSLLDSLLGTPHIAIAQENANALIISDKSNNIKSAMKIVQELDKNGLQEAVIVMRLKERNANDVEALLKNLIEDKMPNHPLAHLFRRPEQMHSFFGPTKIFSEERSNALVLIGAKDATLTIENFIKEHVDIALKTMESPLHIYELQYMDAKQMVELLKEATAMPESGIGQSKGGTNYFKNMVFKADEEGNRIIVATPDRQAWKLMKEIIKDLDKDKPQVGIETLVVIVDSTDTDQLGSQFRNRTDGSLGGGLNIQTPPIQNTVFQTQTVQNTTFNTSLLGNLINGITGTLGQTILTFGKPNNIWGIVQFIQERTRSSIVAQPFLTVTNKFSSEILIGQTNRIAGETALVNGAPVTGFQDTEANLKISVTPQINIDGIINLKITVTVSDFGNSAGNVTINRNLNTAVSIANGQVLALGGFVQTKVQETTGKFPILGDIPIFGWFFKNKQKVVTKNNILIFMCPTIIKPRSMPGINLYTRMKLQQSKQNMKSTIETSNLKDPVHNWFFNADAKDYSYKIDDFASARYQPVTVDIANDEYYRAEKAKKSIEKIKASDKKVESSSKEALHDS